MCMNEYKRHVDREVAMLQGHTSEARRTDESSTESSLAVTAS